MTQVDTPYDCMFSIQWVNTPAGERTLPQVTWVGSKQCLAYPRRVTYRFVADGGYVAMAKAFRRSQQAAGAFCSWEEKIRANPEVERLRGALDLWSQVEITPQMIDRLREAGIRKAIIAKSRGGDPTPAQGIRPDAIRAANEAGYLIGGYHNYSWIQGRWIDRDPALKEAAVMQADGSFKFIANAWDREGPARPLPRGTSLDLHRERRNSRKNWASITSSPIVRPPGARFRNATIPTIRCHGKPGRTISASR